MKDENIWGKNDPGRGMTSTDFSKEKGSCWARTPEWLTYSEEMRGNEVERWWEAKSVHWESCRPW